MLALERLQVEQLQVFQAAELVGASFNHKSRRFGSETCPFAALTSTRARHASPVRVYSRDRASANYSKSRRLGLRAGSLDKKPNTNKPTKILTTM